MGGIVESERQGRHAVVIRGGKTGFSWKLGQFCQKMVQAHSRGQTDAGRRERLAMRIKDLHGRADGDRSAVGLQGDDSIHGAYEVVQIMLDDEDRRASFLEGGQKRVEIRRADRVEICGRLVEYQQCRFDGEGRGQDHPLSLSSGQLPGVRLRVLGHANRFEGLDGPRLDLVNRHQQVLQGVADLVENAGGDDLGVGVLHDHGDMAGQVGDFGVCHFSPRYDDTAAVIGGDRVRHEPIEGECDGGFSAAGGAEQDGGGSGGERERDALGDPDLGAGVAHTGPVQAGCR